MISLLLFVAELQSLISIIQERQNIPTGTNMMHNKKKAQARICDFESRRCIKVVVRV
jgi:hypothetical protein